MYSIIAVYKILNNKQHCLIWYITEMNVPLSVAQAPQFQLWTIELCQPDDDPCKCSLKQRSHKVIHKAQIKLCRINK